MWSPKSELVSESALQAQPCLMLSENVAQKIRINVIEKHVSRKRSGYRLFENFYDDVCCNEKDSLQLLKGFPYADSIFVFFDDSDGCDVLEFSSLGSFLSVYSNCALFTVYVTDIDGSFIICYTSEQALICTASAADWLELQMEE